MVDTRIARYLAFEGARIGFLETGAVSKTLKRYRENPSPGVLTVNDWSFVEMWLEWCREMTRNVPRTHELTWRARDIEMAVFRAWGEESERGKGLTGPYYRL